MRHISGVRSLALAIIFFLMASGAAMAQTEAGAPANPVDLAKVRNALTALGRAQTLAQASQSLKSANLTPQELKELSDQIGTGPLSRKLEGLKNQALASSKLPKTGTGPDADQLLKLKRAALEKARAAAIAESNKAVMKLKPVNVVRMIAPATSKPRTQLSAQAVAALASTAGAGPSARITDISAPVVGREMTIRGTGFGNTEGRVVFLVNRDLYACDVTTWTSTRIVCTVADDLDSALEGYPDGRELLLWVKLAGGETGPTLDTRVLPNPEAITPIIDNITPTDISPGQSFIIRGRNLAKYRVDRATVELLFPDGSSVQTTIQDPQKELIQAKIPDDFGGMPRTICRLVVTNDYGRKAEQTVTFVPAEEIVAIRTPGHLLAACQPPFPGFLCLIGDTSRATVHDVTLANGWVVEDCVLDVNASGVNAGAYYVERPDRGATLARAVVEAWADAYSRCVAIETLFIKGPRGVAYR